MIGVMMRITDIRCTRVALPLPKPLGVGSWWNQCREFILAWVETDAGIVGNGFCYGGFMPGQGKMHEVIMKELIRPILIGEDPRDVERLWAKMYTTYTVMARKGVFVWALSAIDLALWDIKAKALREPLWRLLGGARNEVLAYATGGYYRPNEGLDELAEEMGRYRAAGIRAVKLKLGQLSPRADAERVKVCREVLGDDIKLAIDANNAWKTSAEAIQAIRHFEPYDLWFVEEPVGADNLSAAADLVARLDVPIANGEPAVTRWDLRDLVQNRACDILQIDATAVGGITEWIKGAHMAECFDLPVVPVWFADLSIHLATAVPHAIAVEYHVPEESTFRFSDLLLNPLKLVDGMACAPNRDGIGIEYDDDKIKEFAQTN
jgi:D-arabinonate dehydratase